MEKKFKNIQTFEQHTDKNLNISDVISRLCSKIENEYNVKNNLFMTFRKDTGNMEFYEVDYREDTVERYLTSVSLNDL